MNYSDRKKYALITGASAGLGKAMARECANRGLDLILVSLPEEGLLPFGQLLREECGVEVHCYETDLTQPREPHRLAKWVKERFPVFMLINNAGVGGSLLIEQASPTYIDYILQLNIRAVSMLTYHFIPELKKHERSYIMNVASLAAFGPIPFKTVYPASKAFVYAFSHSLRAELKHTPISVTVVNPGAMLTNADVIQRAQRHGWLSRQSILTAESAAKESIDGMLRGRRMVIPGVLCKLSYWLMRMVPIGMQFLLLARMFKSELEIYQQEEIAYLGGRRMPLGNVSEPPVRNRGYLLAEGRVAEVLTEM